MSVPVTREVNSIGCPGRIRGQSVGRCEEGMERETGIEPATNSLEGCDSTIELLPPALDYCNGFEFTGMGDQRSPPIDVCSKNLSRGSG